MQKVKVTDFGSKVQGIELKANKNSPEPEEFRIKIPGGDVSIVRTTDCQFWVHVRVNRPESTIDLEDSMGRIVDARLDIHGKHASDSDVGDFGHRDLYHLAVRVAQEET
jgi:hypothetical protein